MLHGFLHDDVQVGEIEEEGDAGSCGRNWCPLCCPGGRLLLLQRPEPLLRPKLLLPHPELLLVVLLDRGPSSRPQSRPLLGQP